MDNYIRSMFNEYAYSNLVSNYDLIFHTCMERGFIIFQRASSYNSEFFRQKYDCILDFYITIKTGGNFRTAIKESGLDVSYGRSLVEHINSECVNRGMPILYDIKGRRKVNKKHLIPESQLFEFLDSIDIDSIK